MIAYSMYRTMQRIFHRAVGNGYLMLRLLFGFTLLFLSLTLIACAQQTKVDPRYTDTNIKRLSFRVRNVQYEHDCAIDLEELQFLREQYPAVSFEMVGSSQMFVGDIDDMEIVDCIMCSPSLASQMGETAPLDAEMSSKITKGLTHNMLPEKMVENLLLALRDGRVYELTPSAMASNMFELERSEEEESKENKMILFLCEPDWYEDKFIGWSVLSYAQFPEMEAQEKHQMITDMHQVLSLRHPNSRVVISDSDEKVHFAAYHSENTGEQLSMFAMLLLVVVLVGILGSYLVVCDNRMREFGILLDMGVPRTALALELVLENMFLFGLSSLLSCLVGSLCVGLFQYPGIVIRAQPGVFGQVFLLSLLLSAGMAVVGIFKLGHASSVCIKRGE